MSADKKRKGKGGDWLDVRRRRFVAEYLVDLNAERAAVRAGYSKSFAAHKAASLLRHPGVAKALDAAQKDRAARTGVTQDRVVAELARVAFGTARAVMSWGPGGVVLKESAALSEDEAAIVSEASETTSEHGGSLKVKTHDKVKALELLGRHLGMFTDNLNLNGQGLAEAIVAARKRARG